MKSRNTQHLTEEENKIKTGLKGLGSELQKSAEDSKKIFLSKIEELYESTESGSFWMRFTSSLRRTRALILVPVGLVALVLTVQLSRLPSSKYIPLSMPLSRPYPMGDLEDSLGLGDGGILSVVPPSGMLSPESVVSEESFLQEAGFSGSASALGRRSTFKERFLDRLGLHEASPGEVASRPQIFEQETHLDLMATKEEDETRAFMKTAFESLGGFINSMNTYSYRTRSIQISGRVPARSLEAFRIMMQNFAKEPKYYRESAAMYNRTSDIVAIENEREKVEKSIAYLEESLARETDPQKRASLEWQLATHRARLRERDTTRQTIEDRVEYADVSITLQLLPTFWHANSLRDFRQLYVGFGEATILDTLKINATAVALFILHALSYLFWIIPLVWLWWRKSYRVRGLFDELE